MAVKDPGGWASEFLAAENERPLEDWTLDFLGNHGGENQPGNMLPGNQQQVLLAPSMKWASEYLDSTEQKPWCVLFVKMQQLTYRQPLCRTI